MRTVKDAETLRDTLLMLVYLDQWREYRPFFPVEKLTAASRQFPRLSSLLDWIRREGAVHAN
jgi:hypothetical protein